MVKITSTILVFGSLLIGLMGLARPVFAQASSAGDVVSAVNALRQARGLAPYQVSSDLMSFAQAHSDYQAKIGSCTHLLADGSTPFSQGISENIVCGNDLSIETGIARFWQDAAHQSTMFGYSAGYVGAGVALKGSYVYYTLDVRQSGGSAPAARSQANPGTPQPTAVPAAPLVTATANPDGSIIHVVGAGQSLWSIAIAYGMKIADILKLSNLPPTTTTVYVGEKLTIRKALPASQTPTQTAILPTMTLTPTASHLPPTPTISPTVTLTATITLTVTPTLWYSAILPRGLGNQKYMGIGLVALCLIGLAVVGFTGFRRK